MNFNMDMKQLTTDLLIRYGFQVLGAIAILVVGFLVARWLGGLADKRFQKQQMEPPMRSLMVRVIKILVLIMAFVVALDKFGFSIAPLVAGIGVAGLGVGFALQGVLGNLMAGLTIIFTKPFRVGEYIEINNVRGEVTKIELSTTTLVQIDHSHVIVPNRKIVGEIVHNFSTMRMLTLTVRVPHNVDLNAAFQAAAQVASQNGRVLKNPAPSVGIDSMDDNGIKLALWAWVHVTDVFSAEPDLYQSLVEAFRARGIGTPAASHQVRMLEPAGAR
jgi:small conductance mechanosensitive channel